MTDQIDKDAQNTHELTARVARALIARGWRLTTAESCTGGNLAAALCAQADTAAFYDTGVVTFSGYAGPEGGEDGTPAGTVWFAWNFRGQIETQRMRFTGDCEAVVAQAVRFAMAALGEKLAHWQ